MRQSVAIRVAEPADAPVLAGLCQQLGRDATVDEVRAYLERGRSEDGHCVLVAHEGGSVLGWLEVATRGALGSPVWAELSGLVVDAPLRGQGVGAELLRAARRWAQEQGVARLRVRSRTERQGAASFYERSGFRPSKQQRVFELEL
jgi:GNAT superfamily N-acetyltransferase